MLNINSFYEVYEQYKPILLNLFTAYYGCEYKDVIQERLDNTTVIFTGNPKDDLGYALEKDVDGDLLAAIKNVKIQYCDEKDELELEIKNKLCDFLSKQKKNPLTGEYSLFYKLGSLSFDILSPLCFSLDNRILFNSGLIDSFSTDNLHKLADSTCSDKEKISILNNQEYCKSLFPSINFEDFSCIIDEFITMTKKIIKRSFIYNDGCTIRFQQTFSHFTITDCFPFLIYIIMHNICY